MRMSHRISDELDLSHSRAIARQPAHGPAAPAQTSKGDIFTLSYHGRAWRQDGDLHRY